MSAKAANYLEQLDRARCEGTWSAVPELVRKVRKHAPDRSCLAITAETECAISNATHAASVRQSNPSSSSSTPPVNLDITTLLPKLLEAIDNETKYAEDSFQAQVCAGWLHWVVADYSLALTHLPSSLDPQETNVDLAESTSEWTTVCALKAAYLRANCLSRDSQNKQSLAAFLTGLPALSRLWSGQGPRKQLGYWSELYLTEYCMASSQAIKDDESLLQDPNSIACFRSWARYWEIMSAPVIGGYGFRGSVPRRRVWNEYYRALSQILDDDLPFPSGYVGKITNDMSARAQLRLELKTSEAAYQTLLLTETTFPRADEERAEVEAFVRLVVRNWSILCGRGWREQDLGPGGRNSLTRGVLDILYSAAMKTYHSTAILRSLFVIHISVAEFELAFKAFDSYLDIVKKCKVRVDKTGHVEPNLDDDGTVLETLSQAIILLCRYGQLDVAEKARQLGAELEDWMARLPQLRSSSADSAAGPTSNGLQSDVHPPIAPHVLALSWQAIGISHAHWSRATHEAASRPEIQSRAIRCLRRSLAPELGRSRDVRGYFCLALLLAERRELTAAIEVVKTALLTSKGREAQYHLLHGPYWQERSLIPMWHLLSLLLSARQDYVLASRACEGALEQFQDPSVLFGKGDLNFRSEHLKDAHDGDSQDDSQRGLVDEMDDAEKEGVLEVKMTQLSLVELLEGPEVAVNASYELLTLFSRLFGNIVPPVTASTLATPRASEPPKTSGTLKSIRGTIFGGRSRPPTRQTPTTAVANEKTGLTPTRPGTARTVGSTAPAIQVTGDQPPPSRKGSVGHPRGTKRSDSAKRNSLKKRDRSMSRRRPSTSDVPAHATVVEEEPAASDTDQSDFYSTTSSIKREVSSASSYSRGRPLPTLNSFLSSVSKSSEDAELSADATYTSGDLLPLIQFPSDKERVQRTTILIRVWLKIGGFYRRANLFDDCEGAVTEAQKLVQSLEADLHREPSVSTAVKNSGWAEKRSIEDLWGDVYSEFGLLSLARNTSYDARSDFETALTHSPNHPVATVGLSNILLDVYSEEIRPEPLFPPLGPSEAPAGADDKLSCKSANNNSLKSLPSTALGLASSETSLVSDSAASSDIEDSIIDGDGLPEPYKATCLPLADRLAARDRAHALLSGLTRLGNSWNDSDAWFALARAHEESGQPDKAKEVLWWCIELEEARPVRDWGSVGAGGYVL